MGHVQDLWMKRGPDGKKDVRSARYGKGKRWQARWTDASGNEPTKVFGSKDAAEAYVSRMEVDVNDGSYIDPMVGKQTFREYAEGWREQQLHYRAKTKVGTESMLRNHVYPTLGDMPMKVIRRVDVQRTITQASQVLGPGSVENVFMKLKTIFTVAELDHVIRESPVVRIMLPEKLHKRVVVLTVDQVLNIYRTIPELYAAPVVACGATGTRKGELFGLTVDRLVGPRDDLKMIIDRQQGNVAGTWMPTKSPKSDRELELGRAASLVVSDHLDQYGPAKTGHVFRTTRGAEVRPGTSAHGWRLAVAEMDLGSRSGWHLLRHHNASMLIRKGLSVTAVSEHLGHSNQQTTYNTYLHLWPDDKARIVASVDEHFTALLAAA